MVALSSQAVRRVHGLSACTIASSGAHPWIRGFYVWEGKQVLPLSDRPCMSEPIEWAHDASRQMPSDCSLTSLVWATNRIDVRIYSKGLEGLVSKSLCVSLQAGRKPGSTQMWRNDLKQDPEQVKKNLDVADAVSKATLHWPWKIAQLSSVSACRKMMQQCDFILQTAHPSTLPMRSAVALNWSHLRERNSQFYLSPGGNTKQWQNKTIPCYLGSQRRDRLGFQFSERASYRNTWNKG